MPLPHTETSPVPSLATRHPYPSLDYLSFNQSPPSVAPTASLPLIDNDFNAYYFSQFPPFPSPNHFGNDIAASDDPHLTSSYWPPIDNLPTIDPSQSLEPVKYVAPDSYAGAEALTNPSLQRQNWCNGLMNPTYDLSAPQFSGRYDSKEFRVPEPNPLPPMTLTNMQRIAHQVTPFRPSHMSQEIREALSQQFGNILTGREGVYQCTISDREVWLVLEGTGERALPVASYEALTRTPTREHTNDTPILPGSLTKVEVNIPSSPSVLRGPYHCCRRMQKSELSGPLPSKSETDAYLYRELGVAPGTEISLALNEQLRPSDTSITSSRSPWKNARVACLLAIRGSQHQALTTTEIFEALIKAVPFCAEKAHLALHRAPRAKRKGWPASIVNVLSKQTIFVQKTPEGRSCKEWRLDVRGEKYQTGSCSHNKDRLDTS